MPCRPLKIAQARDAVQAGRVIAYPTEAVWGLGCDPWKRDAVHRILDLKGRPEAKGLILVAAQPQQLDFLLHDLPAEAQARLQATWPGPVTWLIPHYGRVPHWISGSHPTVAVRVSDHPLVRELCDACGPLVSTSANPQGLAPARESFRVRRYFGRQVHIVPGALGRASKPSEIRDAFTGKIVRAG